MRRIKTIGLYLALVVAAFAMHHPDVAQATGLPRLCRTVTQSGAVVAPCPTPAPHVPTTAPLPATDRAATTTDSVSISSTSASGTGCNSTPPTFGVTGSGWTGTATWVPFACPANGVDGTITAKSPMNQKVSTSPTFASYSATDIADAFSGWTGMTMRTGSGAGDSDHATVFASATDPLVTVNCTGACSTAADYGSGTSIQFRVPAQASFPGDPQCSTSGADHHLGVVQPNGTEIDLYDFGNFPMCNLGFTGGTPWTNGGTYSVGNLGTCGNGWSSTASSTGWYTNNANFLNAGGVCNSAGVVRGSELAAGKINHAINIVLNCGGSSGQYPAASTATASVCTSGNNVPLGAHLWVDVSDATIQAMSIQPYQKALLMALHDYGGYFMDTGCSSCGSTGQGFILPLESTQPYYDFGNHSTDANDPFAALAAQGWTSISAPGLTGWNRWGANGYGSADERLGQTAAWWQAHAHWLAPCAAQGTC